MPTYQYLCTECGHAFEQVQKFSDDALTTCPECTGKLRKVFNSVGVVFKGSGFYKTDSKSSSSASSSASSTAAPAAASASSSSSASSESSGSSSASSAASPA
ncbi:FmdB family zinc ribbon protein [Nocardioides kongjuensis]|uniref:Putative FmdB family regulatory protein n=1 Tax=Nocardioides kongjuensis TaxID=349522 RepID=A0A852RIL6_9ACTN|nr:FmdB family zinc ribbon protein [Nocardioides kongjuensis]NYD33297.1 putative FmdB family regulatory protein [Nocardioides kongjuensis]